MAGEVILDSGMVFSCGPVDTRPAENPGRATGPDREVFIPVAPSDGRTRPGILDEANAMLAAPAPRYVWVVVYDYGRTGDHWVDAVYATEQAAEAYVADEVTAGARRHDYRIERWEVRP